MPTRPLSSTLLSRANGGHPLLSRHNPEVGINGLGTVLVAEEAQDLGREQRVELRPPAPLAALFPQRTQLGGGVSVELVGRDQGVELVLGQVLLAVLDVTEERGGQPHRLARGGSGQAQQVTLLAEPPTQIPAGDHGGRGRHHHLLTELSGAVERTTPRLQVLD